MKWKSDAVAHLAACVDRIAPVLTPVSVITSTAIDKNFLPSSAKPKTNKGATLLVLFSNVLIVFAVRLHSPELYHGQSIVRAAAYTLTGILSDTIIYERPERRHAMPGKKHGEGQLVPNEFNNLMYIVQGNQCSGHLFYE